MFPMLKTDVETRFTATERYFKEAKKLDDHYFTTTKGLMFVQVYAIYEYTVVNVVRLAIDAIKSHRYKVKDIKPSLLALLLDPELRSLKDSGRRDLWDKRIKLLEKVFSNEKIDISSNTNLPTDGSNFKYSHLCLIFRVFGIRQLPVPRKRHISRVDEVVDHRNSIAHGRELAEDIGRRYSFREIVHMMQQMKSVCILLISVFERFCGDRVRHYR